MDDIKEIVLKGIENKNNLTETILLLRLYDEYEKYKQLSIPTTDRITLLSLKNAYDNISEKISTYLSDDELSLDREMFDFILNNTIILRNYFLSFEIENKEKVQKSVDLITKLECLLKLPVSFPTNIERCIEQVINLGTVREGEKNGRTFR